MAEKKEEAPKEEKAPGEEGVKEEKKRKLPIPIIAGVAGVIVIGAAAAFFLLKPGKKADVEGEPPPSAEHGEVSNEHEKSEKKPSESGGEKAPEGGHGEKTKKEGKGGEKKEHQAEGAAASTHDPNISFGATFTFPPFHLNLGNPLENRYIRLEIAVEYKSGAEQLKEIEARKPQLRDAILSVISRKSREFLLGPDGKDQLRLEILNKINQYMDRKVESVYITDMIIE